MLTALGLLGVTIPIGVFVIAAIVLAIVGVVMILQGSVLGGVVMLILAAAVGPGGWWIFRD
jgi:hypothetical protein